jgi:Tfp pilus assembly protein PilF
MISRIILIPILCSLSMFGQSAAPASSALDKAYAALQAKSYEAAIDLFHQAIAADPNRASIRKDLAYVYLRVGEPESARVQFGEAMRIDPQDMHVALEYAFLCNETKQPAEARMIFDRIRKTGNQTAEQAFQNIDKALAEGIVRWSKAAELQPDNFGAHEELARLAEQRNDSNLAAIHYERAFQIKPAMRTLLIDLARVWKAMGRVDDSFAALLAASRSAEPRVSEIAKQLLPQRYPYVYEFKRALEIDPKNVLLHREFAYLHLAMHNKNEAIAEFRTVLALAPDDPLATAQLGSSVQSSKLHERPAAQPSAGAPSKPADSADAATLGTRSLQAGYLKDALRYLKQAHEENPNDYAVMLKLGWTYNILKDDTHALEFFKLAKDSPDASISSEAKRAYDNLRPAQEPYRTTVWTYPMFSSRWHDLFSYSQVKVEFKVGTLPLRPYLSARIIGDVRGSTPGDAGPGGSITAPQYLSENSVIIAAGLATRQYRGLTAWAEAGESIRYRQQVNVGRMLPDYRGGLSFAKSIGHNIGPESHGVFFESTNDAVFVSRFGNDTLFYSQNHFGYTFPWQFQVFWNGNITKDLKQQYWANYYEHGPGIKFRFKGMPPALSLTVSALRGNYLIQEGNPRGPRYNDIRAGLWYAFTH